MSIPDGGPAFPHNSLHDVEKGVVESAIAYGEDHASTGMSLRDYFAGKAMEGLLAKAYFVADAWDNYCELGDREATDFSVAAYCVADAMLLQRAKIRRTKKADSSSPDSPEPAAE